MERNQIPCFSKHLASSTSPYSPLIMVILQGRSSTKIVGGARSQKNVSHHNLPMEKYLGCEWAKTTQMALKFLQFFWNIFIYVQNSSCLPKQFL